MSIAMTICLILLCFVVAVARRCGERLGREENDRSEQHDDAGDDEHDEHRARACAEEEVGAGAAAHGAGGVARARPRGRSGCRARPTSTSDDLAA